MKRIIILLCVLVIPVCMLTGCGSSNDKFIEVEGIKIKFNEMTVRNLVDQGCKIEKVEMPKTLFRYGGNTNNNIYVYLHKNKTVFMVYSRVPVGDIFRPDIKKINKDARTKGVVVGIRIFLDKEYINNGSYNGVDLRDITLDTLNQWKCNDRSLASRDFVRYGNESGDPVHIFFTVNENKETKEIERIRFLTIQYSGK